MKRPTLLYLDRCQFCSACARMVMRLDRKESLAFVSLAGPLAAELLNGQELEERVERWHLITVDGADLTDGEAILRLMEEIPLTKWAVRPARRLKFEALLDRLNRFVGSHRSRLGKLVRDRPGPLRYP